MSESPFLRVKCDRQSLDCQTKQKASSNPFNLNRVNSPSSRPAQRVPLHKSVRFVFTSFYINLNHKWSHSVALRTWICTINVSYSECIESDDRATRWHQLLCDDNWQRILTEEKRMRLLTQFIWLQPFAWDELHAFTHISYVVGA